MSGTDASRNDASRNDERVTTIETAMKSGYGVLHGLNARLTELRVSDTRDEGEA